MELATILAGLLDSAALDWDAEARDALENFNPDNFNPLPELVETGEAGLWEFTHLLQLGIDGHLSRSGLRRFCALCRVEEGAPLVVYMVRGQYLLDELNNNDGEG